LNETGSINQKECYMKNVLALTYWSYPDALVQTYTLPYVRIIKKNLPPDSIIYLVTLEKNKNSIVSAEVGESLKSEGIVWKPFIYRPFGMRAFINWLIVGAQLSYWIVAKKISVIHCWGTPAGAIGFVLSTLTQKKLIIDSYEPHAEAMVENGTWNKNGLAFKLLFWLEKKQSKRADVIIAATAGMQAYAKEKYGVTKTNFLVKPACVDLELFTLKNLKKKELVEKFQFQNKIVCVYAGKFGGIYLDHEIFDFLKICHRFWGDAFRVMLLTNHPPQEIKDYCEKSGLPVEIIQTAFVPHQSIPDYLGLGDFAITPVKPVPTKKYCTPIKDGEYWALGLPVVIPKNISDDSSIIEQNSIGAVLSGFDEVSYREAVVKIDALIKRHHQKRFEEIRQIAIRYRSFEIAENVYRSAYP